jgi:8-oxo-dGTP diphosphatase
MKVYKVIKITEADFGCEETGREEPMALLYLENAAEPEDTRYAEVAESVLSTQGIEEGKKVVFTGNGEIRKYVRVVAALIVDKRPEDGRSLIFATQRGYGEYKDGWEFPGGKIEPGETPQQALKREIMEELDTEIVVGDLIDTIEYDYPKFHLSMDCFWCTLVKGNLILKEHEAARWLDKDTMDSVNWLPADITIIEKIKEGM